MSGRYSPERYQQRADVIRERSNTYYREHRSEIIAKKSLLARQLKTTVIAHYGGECACCGEKSIEFLTIDHIHGDGAAHRKLVGGSGPKVYADIIKSGFPEGRFRVLCLNCNIARGWYGYCPHHPEERSNDPPHRPHQPGRKRRVS